MFGCFSRKITPTFRDGLAINNSFSISVTTHNSPTWNAQYFVGNSWRSPATTPGVGIRCNAKRVRLRSVCRNTCQVNAKKVENILFLRLVSHRPLLKRRRYWFEIQKSICLVHNQGHIWGKDPIQVQIGRSVQFFLWYKSCLNTVFGRINLFFFFCDHQFSPETFFSLRFCLLSKHRLYLTYTEIVCH